MLWEVVTDGGAFTAIEIEGHGFTSDVGAPRLPILRALIEMPQGAVGLVRIEDPVYREISLGTAIDVGLTRTWLTTEAIVHEIPEKDKEPAMPGGGGMGGGMGDMGGMGF